VEFKPVMGNVVPISARVRVEEDAFKGYIPPEHLHQVLAAAQTRVITFRSERSLRSYRRMLYDVNRQGSFRYRTMRDEQSSFGLVLWRMK